MIKSSVSKPMTKFGNEASRRLYRGAFDSSRKLEHRLSVGSSLTELFSSETTDLRIRLKEFCERLIFTDPMEYGRKAEDMLWRKVYYDFFSRCKQNRKKVSESEFHRSCLKSHLLAGIGFYHHLLLRIQTEFHLNLEGQVDAPLLWQLKGVKKEKWKRYKQSEISNEVEIWAKQACHRILIYLGDLERYVSELDEECHHLAERYYHQAFCLLPQSGHPHNQLGSLNISRFDSAYHYMRCLACQQRFDGTENNLSRSFERNEEVMQQLYSPECINKESLKCSRFLSRFLKLCQMFYFKPNENFSPELYCQDILKEFNLTCNEESECLLSDDMVFKVVIMTLMCIKKLQEKDATDASVATAFCIALFSYIVQRTLQRLLSSCGKPVEPLQNGCQFENEIKPHIEKTRYESISPFPEIQMNGNTDENIQSAKNGLSKKSVTKKCSAKKISANRLRTMRRRRKLSSNSQEESDLSEGEVSEGGSDDPNSDLSQSTNDSLSEEDEFVLQEVEEIGDTEINVPNGYNLSSSSPEMNGLGSATIVNDNHKNNFSHFQSLLDDPCVAPDELVETLRGNGLLPCLKILMDWLRTNEHILSACFESSQFLLSCVLQLLNTLLKLEEKLFSTIDHRLSCILSSECLVQRHPLPEDIQLQCFPLLKETQSLMCFDVEKRRELSNQEQVHLRLQCLISFGKCIQASNPLVEFDDVKKRFDFNLCKRHIKETAPTKPVARDIEGQRQYLMKSMAHLWLEAEVHDLEAKVDRASQLSPYLVVDTGVLCSNLPAVKRLVHAKRFIVVVPLVVIASLDQLKRESLGAREAIRWMEQELRKGCRFIRAQRQVEKKSLIPMKYPKKKDKEAWDLFQVLECCNYLVEQYSSTAKNNAANLVTLLVISMHQLPDNATGLATSIDVTIETLASFLSKWRSCSKKPG